MHGLRSEKTASLGDASSYLSVYVLVLFSLPWIKCKSWAWIDLTAFCLWTSCHKKETHLKRVSSKSRTTVTLRVYLECFCFVFVFVSKCLLKYPFKVQSYLSLYIKLFYNDCQCIFNVYNFSCLKNCLSQKYT